MGGFASAALPLVMTGAKQYETFTKQKSARRAQNAETNRLIAIENRRRAAAEREKKKQLKHSLAAQRARFGGAGISGAGGSARAVLRGLERNAADGMADARFESDLRLAEIGRKRGKNLLESSGAFNRLVFADWEKNIPKKGGLFR